jgi:hypothetical protein
MTLQNTPFNANLVPVNRDEIAARDMCVLKLVVDFEGVVPCE